MVCVANVVAVAGVTGQLGKEGSIISRTVLPMLGYVAGFAATELSHAIGLSPPGTRARLSRILGRPRQELTDG